MTADRPIAIIGAMESEINLIIAGIENKSTRSIGGRDYISGTIGDKSVTTVRCFIGMANSAAAAALLIENYNPRCVIIQGTCGGHNPLLHRGDIVIGERVIENSRRETPALGEGEGSRFESGRLIEAEIPCGNTAERASEIFCDADLVEKAKTVPYSKGRLITGCISCGDVWNREIDVLKYLHSVRGSDCEEMEGFAVGQVCKAFGVPFIDIRILSNSELYPEEKYDESYGIRCQEFCLDLIEKL